jgi:hypothetical protein
MVLRLSRSLSIQQFRAVTASDIDGNAILKDFSELLGGNIEYEYVSSLVYIYVSMNTD